MRHAILENLHVQYAGRRYGNNFPNQGKRHTFHLPTLYQLPPPSVTIPVSWFSPSRVHTTTAITIGPAIQPQRPTSRRIRTRRSARSRRRCRLQLGPQLLASPRQKPRHSRPRSQLFRPARLCASRPRQFFSPASHQFRPTVQGQKTGQEKLEPREQ